MNFAIQSALVFIMALGIYKHSHNSIDISKGVIVGLFVSMVILVLDYIFTFQGYACHAQAFSGNPQWAAAFLTMLAAPLYVVWLKNRFVNRVLLHIFIAASLVTVGAFSGARMSFYALSLFFLISLAMQLFTPENRRNALHLFMSVIVGWIILFSIDHISECGFGYRIVSQIN